MSKEKDKVEHNATTHAGGSWNHQMKKLKLDASKSIVEYETHAQVEYKKNMQK